MKKKMDRINKAPKNQKKTLKIRSNKAKTFR